MSGTAERPPIRVLVADDHEVVRRGLVALLEEPPDVRICGAAASGREAVELASILQPDVAVLDVTMPGMNGLEATRQIRVSAPRTEILVLTVHESSQLVKEVVEAGARGYVLKSDAGQDLVDAVRALHQHRTFFTSRTALLAVQGLLGNEGAPAPRSTLTAREREVLDLLAAGRSNKEIAARLGITLSTAETHRTNLMRKLGLHSIAEVVRYALRGSAQGG